jgi:hypothetical protein
MSFSRPRRRTHKGRTGRLFGSPRRRFPRFELLEDRRLLAAVITVNSTADSDVRDDFLTLREALRLNNRTLSFAALSAAEKAQGCRHVDGCRRRRTRLAAGLPPFAPGRRSDFARAGHQAPSLARLATPFTAAASDAGLLAWLAAHAPRERQSSDESWSPDAFVEYLTDDATVADVVLDNGLDQASPLAP